MFWKKYKSLNKQNNKINSNLNFFDHFKNLASKETILSDQGKIEVENLFSEDDLFIDDLDVEVNIEELNNTIKTLKKNKSGGNDGIINEFIINAPSYVKDFLVLLFNTIIKLEYIPEGWCIGTIVPVFKSGDQGYREVNNYRGITLISVICKYSQKL